ncbi:putative lipoprotein YsaB [Escherichia coli]|nr:putative lipoprotein YsaB [Escherichia coli]
MMMNAFFPAMALIVLVGCSTPPPVQKAQRVKVDPLRSLNMEALCKDQAAKRYNTGEQKIDVTAFEQFQGSYEMRGYTFRKEQFVCSFDADTIFCIFPCVKPCFFPFRTVYLPSSGYTDPFL